MLWGRGKRRGHLTEHLLALCLFMFVGQVLGPQAEGDDSIASSRSHLHSGIGTCSGVHGVAQVYEEDGGMRQSKLPETGSHPGAVDQHPHSTGSHKQCCLTHVLSCHTWESVLRGPTLMLSEESPGWVKGPLVGHLGSGSSLVAASCSTSWEPVQEGEPMRSPSRLGCQGCCCFMWFQLASVIQDFKGSPVKEGPACLPPPKPAPVSGPLPES